MQPASTTLVPNARIRHAVFLPVTATLGLAVATALAGATAPVAALHAAVQQPALSGSWTAVPDAPPGIAAAPSAVMGGRFALHIAGDTASLLRPARGEVIAATFTIGGARTRVRVPGRPCEGDAALFETIAWEGDALAITTVGAQPPGGGAVRELNARRVLRLVDPDTLVVEGTLVRGGEPQTVASLYRRGEPLEATLPAGPANAAAATIAEVAWVSGDWAGTTDGVTSEERWTPAASGALIGMARTLRGAAMSSYEFLCIAEKNGSLVYNAMPDGDATATPFFLTAVTATSALFENPAHDYPKSIRYALSAAGALEATIGGAPGERTRTVVLQRQR